MDYMVIDRELVSLDEERAVFTQRRQLLSCPPGSARGIAAVLMFFGLLPWFERINPAERNALPSEFLSVGWTVFFFATALILVRFRERRREAYAFNARRLGADIDVGACPGATGLLGASRTFTVRFDLPDGRATLEEDEGTKLATVPGGRLKWLERTGHSFPWSDANEGDPHDSGTIFFLLENPPSADFDGRFTLAATSIDDPKLAGIRVMLKDVSAD